MDIKKSIGEWFNGPQDYQEGLYLLEQVSKKHKVMAKLNRGESKTRREKLLYELASFIGLRKIPEPKQLTADSRKSVETNGQKVASGTKKVAENTNVEKLERYNLIGKEESIDDYPEAVKKIIIEYSSLYMKRGKLHREMTDLGPANTKDIIDKREELVGKIHKASERMGELFHLFLDYKNGGSGHQDDDDDDKEEGNADQTGLKGSENIEDLKKLKKNIQASLVKDRNILEFGRKTKPEGKKSNPLPDGAKRIKLEKRVKAKEDQIAAIDLKLAQLE
jgi:hypothetical protein